MTSRYTPARIARAIERRARWKIAEEYAVAKARYASLRGDPVDLRSVFSHVDDESWLALNTRGLRSSGTLRKLLPSMPDPTLQKNYIGSSGDPALREAWKAYCLWRELAARHGRPIGADSYVLDFGCGWGRTIRFFLRDVPPNQLYGADVLDEAIRVSRETNKVCQFVQVPSSPPSELPAGRFDLIYLYSVFSHLSEEVHQKWLNEFHRLLRPGGILIATTWQREYIERCERARNGNTQGTHPDSLRAFVGTEDWLARYDRGEFCFSPVGGASGALEASYYGETCIPEAYVRKNWSDRFDICEYLYADSKRLWQNAIVARRR
ncbi:MAG TPA: methyltransferase [Polyangiaceae bacterium]|jgi:SAM-dependent methyltransferase|nr:methyltransferase [Polyangiaceae bacterium]